MKYTKQILFLLFLNLIIVFISIYIGNLTRKLELSINKIKQDIKLQKEELSINKIEFSIYNHPDYLKKLHQVYFSFDEKNIEKKIATLSNISKTNNENLIFVNLNSN